MGDVFGLVCRSWKVELSARREMFRYEDCVELQSVKYLPRSSPSSSFPSSSSVPREDPRASFEFIPFFSLIP